MPARGDQVPDFGVQTIEGRTARYGTIWQRRNLVLLVLPPHHLRAADEYAARLSARQPEFAALQAECVITRDPVPGLPPPAVLVADRWGEIVHVAASPDVEHLPEANDLLEWLDYTERRCPECEGEAR